MSGKDDKPATEKFPVSFFYNLVMNSPTNAAECDGFWKQ